MIRQIKEMAARGGSTKDIARHLGLSLSTIHKVRQGYYDHRLARPMPCDDDAQPGMIAVWCSRCRCHVYPPCQVCRLREHQRRRLRGAALRREAPLPRDLHDPQVVAKLQLSVAEVGLPVRVVNYLQHRQIFTINDLLHCTREELLRIPNFAAKTLDQVYRCLRRLGFMRCRGEKTPPNAPRQRRNGVGRTPGPNPNADFGGPGRTGTIGPRLRRPGDA
jgi:hypothetical protein